MSLKPLDPLAPDAGPDMPVLFKGLIPLYRDDFISALQSGGVDNIDLYDARITDPDDGSVHLNYKAVDIIGMVSAADMLRSTATARDNILLVDVEFDEPALDEVKAGGLLIFRLAENNSAVLVHRRLRDHLAASGYVELEFYELDQVAL